MVATLAVLGGKFRTLERMQFKNPDYQVQADEIEKLTKKYNGAYIGIDTIGMGGAVYQLVRLFYPAVTAINKSIESQSGIEIFTFGEPESVLDHGRIVEHFQSLNNGRWYEPPISLDGLSRSLRARPHHSSSISVWPARSCRTRCCRAAHSVLLCWIIWCLEMPTWSVATTGSVRQ